MSGEVLSLVEACHENGLLRVSWDDSSESAFHPIWLRDNCRCDDCGDPAIGYRKLRLTEIDPGCRPRTIEVAPPGLRLTWQDGHRSAYSASWLRQHAYDNARRKARAFRAAAWDRDFRDRPPSFDYARLNGDDGLLQLLEKVRDHGLAFVHGAPAEPGVAETLARRFGIPQESNFGRVQDLVFDPRQRSIAFDVKALKPHTDEPYRASPPGLLVFHCVANDQSGAGQSLFMDGFELAERLRARDPEGFAALCDNPHPFRRHYAGEVDLVASFPILSVDEFGNLCGIRLNDRVAAPLSIAPERVEVYYRALRYLLEQAEDENLMLGLTLKPGDIAIFDNHRVLHGRSHLTINGQRWLQWLQIERGDFHSSLRILADRLGKPRDAEPLMNGAYGASRCRSQT